MIPFDVINFGVLLPPHTDAGVSLYGRERFVKLWGPISAPTKALRPLMPEKKGAKLSNLCAFFYVCQHGMEC